MEKIEQALVRYQNAYSEAMNSSLELSIDDDQFGEFQESIFDEFSNLLVLKFGMSSLAAANTCRMFIHLWKPKQSPYSSNDLKKMYQIICKETC